jgi:2-amino-4-hydroxy-6-hydroxymethyldihydropteridine diphosphokinase
LSASPSTEAVLWFPAYVALGSNLDQPVAQIERAFTALANLAECRLIARSRLYRTQPLGPQDQPEFINAAAGLLTTLTPRQLLVELKRLERELGRAHPVVRWGPRLIDLDLLVHADARISESDLTVPHRGLPERNFVLYPLRDIAPELLVPGHGRVSQLAARVGGAGLALLADASGVQ